MYDIIMKKRNGEELSKEEIEEIKDSILELGLLFEYKNRPLYWTVYSPPSVSKRSGVSESIEVPTKLKTTHHQKALYGCQLI